MHTAVGGALRQIGFVVVRVTVASCEEEGGGGEEEGEGGDQSYLKGSGSSRRRCCVSFRGVCAGLLSLCPFLSGSPEAAAPAGLSCSQAHSASH